MPSYPINYHLYTYLWKKYRPMVLKLMVDAAEAPQQYQFAPHEFKDINQKEKGGHSFTLLVTKGKAQNNIKPSVVAQDLLEILQKSGKAMELMETTTYEIVMNKHFELHISIAEQEEEEVEELVEAEMAEG